MISFEQAVAAVCGARVSRPAVTLPLADALGMRLAAPIIARVTRPHAAISAMDGYAVRRLDVASPGARLRIIGEAPAGTPFTHSVAQGEAVRIFTGGEVPPGADHIVVQERAARSGGMVTIADGYAAPEFVRKAGRDFSSGDVLVPAGTTLGAAELAVAAAANYAALSVWPRLRVAILANGDELQAPGSDLLPGALINANPAALGALITLWGGAPTDLGIAADSLASIQAKIAAAAQADIILPVGGASVGDHDYMRAAFAASGFTPVFAQVAVQPGKPTWLSRRGDQIALGLPGNPASALVCAQLFLKPLLFAGDGLEFVTARLSAPLPQNGPREAFLRARVYVDASGTLRAAALPDQDSALLSPFLMANALIRRRPHAAAALAQTLAETIILSPFTQGPD
jgi:molybdopterin molybdotransferase